MRLSDERGFTMITTILATFAVLGLSVVALAAANGDIRLSRYDQDDKQAYAAAEAGVNDYLAHLDQDSNYWAQCTGPGNSYPGVNLQFTGTPPVTRKWRAVPGETNSDYSIELIPRRQTVAERRTSTAGPTACDAANPVESMIDGGNFSIRSTGRVNGKNKRSIVATFRRTGFLDFIYYTDLENQDPRYFDFSPYSELGTRNMGGVGPNDLKLWAADRCKRYRWGSNGRETQNWVGEYDDNGTWTDIRTLKFGTTTLFPNGVPTSAICGEITFASDDEVNGPFHSNDDIQVCGTPDFGRLAGTDRVEIQGDEVHDQCGGSAPNFRPSLTKNAQSLGLPPSNGSIQQAADAASTFSGETNLRLSGTNVTVKNAQRNNGNEYTVPLPANGVIFVKSVGGCGSGYKPDDTESVDPNCGFARVSGNYAQDLTIATEDDIIVDGNLVRASDTSKFVLGLVAKNFVRVWHPINPDCSNRVDTPRDIRIDAAILSLAHSFTVDNYRCGVKLGNLDVEGVIAQKHRGIVGTGGSGGTGYIKKYDYDDRLKYRSPPYFLDPVQSSWRILRQTEQSPAR